MVFFADSLPAPIVSTASSFSPVVPVVKQTSAMEQLAMLIALNQKAAAAADPFASLLSLNQLVLKDIPTSQFLSPVSLF